MPTEEQQIRASDRYDICNKCDEKAIKLEIEYCKKCGCPLKGKVFSDFDGCPLKKW
jgi:ribosomal protein L37E